MMPLSGHGETAPVDLDAPADAVPAPQPVLDQPSPLALLALALSTGVLVAFAAWLTQEGGGMAGVWYAPALAVAALLRHRARHWPLLLAVVALADGLAMRLYRDDWPTALAAVPPDLVQISLGAWLLRQAGLAASGLRAGRSLLRLLLLGGLLPAVPAAALAAGLAGLLGRAGSPLGWLYWFQSAVLGAAALLPLSVLVLGQPWARSRAALQDLRLWVLAPLTVATALLCLVHLPFPFVYLGIPLLAAAMLVDLVGVALLAWLCSLTVVGALVGGAFVPPPVTAQWQELFVTLACTAALVPPQLLGASLAELRDSHARLLERKSELKRANEGLQQFVRIASHDLREPLNTIAQFSDLLAQDHGQRLPPDGQRWLALVQAEARRMRLLLDDVLQYAQVRQGALPPPCAVALDGVVADALQALAARVHATQADVQVDALPAVLGHSSLLTLLVQNLLANALKFQPVGQRPVVRVSARSDGHWVTLSVADNGIGVAASQQDRLFKPFSRLHRRRDYDGTGLGLALCQQIAQAHGGEVSLQSGSGLGAEFLVRLPAAAD